MMMFNPELGFYPYLATVATTLERPVCEIEAEADKWRPPFDEGLTASQAISAAIPEQGESR